MVWEFVQLTRMEFCETLADWAKSKPLEKHSLQ